MSTESAAKLRSAEKAPGSPCEAKGPARTLDDLARLPARDLALLYATAKTPRVEDLEGPLTGRMLAIPAVEGAPLVSTLLRKYAASPVFAWQGKTFKTLGAGRGEGLNRVLGNRASWFRFETSVGKSRAGDFDAVQLDYDNPGNPFVIRAIKDEVREVAPGLWLGQSYALFRKKARLVLYFGLAKVSGF